MLKLFYGREAQDDLGSIYEYIAKEAGLRIADRVVDSITSTCEDLLDFPRMGHHRPELDKFDFEVRVIHERGYVIFYTKFDDGL